MILKNIFTYMFTSLRSMLLKQSTLTVALILMIFILCITEFFILKHWNVTVYESNKGNTTIGFKIDKPTVARYPSLPDLEPTHVRIKQLEPITLITKENIATVQKYVKNGAIGLIDEYNTVEIGNYVAYSSTELVTHLGNKSHQFIMNPKLQKFVTIEKIGKYE